MTANDCETNKKVGQNGTQFKNFSYLCPQEIKTDKNMVIVSGIDELRGALLEAKEAIEGKRKLNTLDNLINELRNSND